MNDWKLPDELEALDLELDSIRYTERASFGAELRRELQEKWESEYSEEKPGAARRLTLAFERFSANRLRREAALATLTVAATALAFLFLIPGPRQGLPTDVPKVAGGMIADVPGAYAALLHLDFTGPDRRALLVDALKVVYPNTAFDDLRLLVEGSKPRTMSPTRWNAFAERAFQRAAGSSPDNAAPLLALARIRAGQGMRDQAAGLFEQGIARVTEHPSMASPELVASLLVERGELWLEGQAADVLRGSVPTSAINPDSCPEVTSSDGSSLRASTRQLVAWNYLCPDEFGFLIANSFEADSIGAFGRTTTPDRLSHSLFAVAAEIDPGHADANVNYLLPFTDGRWHELLRGAERFRAASAGAPEAHILSGLALQRLGRSAEAALHLQIALDLLPYAKARAIRDVTSLLTGRELVLYRSLNGSERQVWEEEFWAGLDPDPTTPVNEREVEHLARAGQALLRFGDLTCDPAQVWVRYGRPSLIRVVSGDGEHDTEFWDIGTGTDATFVRLDPRLPPVLTLEGRAYLDDLSDTFPHRGVITDG
ncbi:MAG: hypothetical protein J4G12_01390 [Gemmatimonadetes bacterium]|nr:hypothetical protein [Gemmatimonadota bacterium]